MAINKPVITFHPINVKQFQQNILITHVENIASPNICVQGNEYSALIITPNITHNLPFSPIFLPTSWTLIILNLFSRIRKQPMLCLQINLHTSLYLLGLWKLLTFQHAIFIFYFGGTYQHPIVLRSHSLLANTLLFIVPLRIHFNQFLFLDYIHFLSVWRGYCDSEHLFEERCDL